MKRMRPLMASLAVTGLIAGGGAAIATAATSGSSTAPSSAPAKTSAPKPGRRPAHAAGARGARNCPNM
jgi:hypothetical protein